MSETESSTSASPVTLRVNGETVHTVAALHDTLLTVLRDRLQLTAAKRGCNQGVCGACTVQVDGRAVRSCLTLAAQADSADVRTIEGLSHDPVVHALQDSFVRCHAMQCGFCSSGMLLAAAELVEKQPKASREQVREWISGNYCRCTGYHSIVDAIVAVLDARSKGQKIKPVVANA